MTLNIRNLKKEYDSRTVFDSFSIGFEDNVINCILGESGCGKTTLLNIIAGLEEYSGGSITGVEGCTFSYIFQEPRLLEWHDVRQNMEFVLADSGLSDINKRIDRYLGITGLMEYSDYYPGQLSGGMKQRLSIARAFAYPGDILLMDEPFKALDMKLKNELMKEFLRLWESDRRTVLFVTHELEEALMMADNIHILGGEPGTELYSTEISVPREQRGSDKNEIVLKRKMLYSFFTAND